MTFAERNYDANESEMLAMMKTCKQWRHYVENAKHQILIIIDHVNLRTFLIIKILSKKKVKWWKRFSKFDLFIEYHSNKLNSANASFKRSDYVVDSTNHEVQNIMTNSSTLNDNQRIANRSELSHEQHVTRNVIVICI
jgi:hypothetical protein